MAVIKRKAKTILMRFIVKKVRQGFSEMSFGEGENGDGLQKLREEMAQRESGRRRKKGVVTRKKEISGVPVELTASVGKRNNDIIIYLHGGAFVLGIAFYHRKYAEALSSHTGSMILMPEYSLAPEHPFPAALDDCEKVYMAVREQHPESRIILAGDSAGGGLCLALTLRLRSKGEKLPCCLILHSPVTDLSGEIDRSVNDDINNDVIIKKGTGKAVNSAYTGNADPKNEEVSPRYGDVSGFPPAFITCETHETLYADSLELDARLEKAGVCVKTIEMDGAYHTFGTLGDLTIETRRITREIADFISEAKV